MNVQGITYQSVSDLVLAFNRVLEAELPEVFFEGEISQLTRAQSGHLYFTLKDEQSQLSAVMWQGVVRTLDFTPEPGKLVLCHGRPNVYPKSGRLQVIVHRMLEAGEGLLQKKFLALKENLEKEGLFADTRKRKIPFLPKAVGVVTSGTGAVIHDIMVKIHERMPPMPVYLVDVRVQGEGAAQEIAEGIELLNRSGLVDVILVGRGGGSLEDLWAFNEEIVVRAIFASVVPVIAGVGHEVDVSLSDLAADLRAPTPTAAAEMAVPQRKDLLERIAGLQKRLWDVERWFEPRVQELDELSLALEKGVGTMLQECRLQLTAAEAKVKLIQPADAVLILKGKLDLLSERLCGAGLQVASAGRMRLEQLRGLLDAAFPLEKVTPLGDRLAYLEANLQEALLKQVQLKRHRLVQLSSKMDALSPQQVLRRGYSLVKAGTQVVRSVNQIEKNQELFLTFYEGGARTLVKERIEGKGGPNGRIDHA